MPTAKSNSPQVMIVTGELSGEHHGAKLAKALQAVNPQINLFGVGGKEMAASGVELLFDISSMAVVGLWEVLAKLKTIAQVFYQLSRRLKKDPPDLLILIDYPDFNLRLAKVAQKHGVKVLYYISPQVWAWRKGRTKKIAYLVDKIAVILPFEAPLYEEAGVDVEFVGHPLLEVISASNNTELKEKTPGKPIIGLLPGSRQNEINFLLTPLLEAAKILLEQNPGVSFMLPVASSLDYKEIQQQVVAYCLPIELVQGQARKVMENTSLIIVASGTATLEAALIGVPMLVIYKVAWLTYFLGRILVDMPYIALANVVAGKAIVPELIQKQATSKNIAASAHELLTDKAKRIAMKEELAKVRTKLGRVGASKQVARIAYELMEEHATSSRKQF